MNPEAQQRYVEDSANASLCARKSENAGLGRKIPFLGGHYASVTHPSDADRTVLMYLKRIPRETL